MRFLIPILLFSLVFGFVYLMVRAVRNWWAGGKSDQGSTVTHTLSDLSAVPGNYRVSFGEGFAPTRFGNGLTVRAIVAGRPQKETVIRLSPTDTGCATSEEFLPLSVKFVQEDDEPLLSDYIKAHMEEPTPFSLTIDSIENTVLCDEGRWITVLGKRWVYSGVVITKVSPSSDDLLAVEVEFTFKDVHSSYTAE